MIVTKIRTKPEYSIKRYADKEELMMEKKSRRVNLSWFNFGMRKPYQGGRLDIRHIIIEKRGANFCSCSQRIGFCEISPSLGQQLPRVCLVFIPNSSESLVVPRSSRNIGNGTGGELVEVATRWVGEMGKMAGRRNEP